MKLIQAFFKVFWRKIDIMGFNRKFIERQNSNTKLE